MSIFSKKTEDGAQPARRTFSEELRGNEIADLRSRARRRLIGATLIALVAIIVLPLIFDSAPDTEPKTTAISLNTDGKPEIVRAPITVISGNQSLNPEALPPTTPTNTEGTAPTATVPPSQPPQPVSPAPVVTPPPAPVVTPPPARPPVAQSTSPSNTTPPKPTAPTPVASATNPPTDTSTRPPAVPAPPNLGQPGSSTQPSAPQPAAPAPSGDKIYRLQFGAFSTKERAEEVRINLMMKAQMDAQIDTTSTGIFRVRSKKTLDKAEAERLKQEILKNTNIESSLVSK